MTVVMGMAIPLALAERHLLPAALAEQLQPVMSPPLHSLISCVILGITVSASLPLLVQHLLQGRILAAIQQSEGSLDKCLLPVLLDRDIWTRCEYERRRLLLARILSTFAESDIERLDMTTKRRLLQLARYDTAGNWVPARIAEAVRRSLGVMSTGDR